MCLTSISSDLCRKETVTSSEASACGCCGRRAGQRSARQREEEEGGSFPQSLPSCQSQCFLNVPGAISGGKKRPIHTEKDLWKKKKKAVEVTSRNEGIAWANGLGFLLCSHTLVTLFLPVAFSPSKRCAASCDGAIHTVMAFIFNSVNYGSFTNFVNGANKTISPPSGVTFTG